MIPLIASALFGLAGYQNNENRKRRESREDVDDAWKAKERARQDAAWKADDELKADLKSAASPVSMDQGAGGMVKPATMDNRDVGLPETANMPNGGLMQGMYKVGDKSFSDKAEADKTLAEQNTPDAIAQRTVQAYRKNGQVEKAMSMENAVMDGKVKKLGLSEAELNHANREFNRRVDDALNRDPANWKTGAAQMIADTNVGGLSGVGYDQALEKLKKFPDTAQGKADFLAQTLKTDPVNKINYLVERTKADQAQSNWQQTFDFNKKKDEGDTQYKNRLLGFHANQEARAAQVHKLAMEDAKVPAAVKLQASSLSDEMKSISTAMNKAMAEGSFDPNSSNAKALIERQALIGIKYRQLLEPHMPGGGKKAADPLGLGSDKPATATTPAATTPAAPTAAPQTAPRPAVSMQSVAPAMAPKAPPTVLEALVGPGGNPSVAQVMQPKAQAVEALAGQFKQAQAALAQAAKGGNPQATVAQSQQVGALRQAIEKQVADMNPQQAALVLQAAGIN